MKRSTSIAGGLMERYACRDDDSFPYSSPVPLVQFNRSVSAMLSMRITILGMPEPMVMSLDKQSIVGVRNENGGFSLGVFERR